MKRNHAFSMLTILFAMNVVLAQPGSLDYNFGQGGKVITDISQLVNFGYKLLVQPDGKIIQIGFSAPSEFYGNFSIVRYDADGLLDNSFGTNGMVETSFGVDEDVAFSGILQTDGKIIAAGYTWNGNTHDFAMVRYTTEGFRDMNFGVNGIVTTDFANMNDRTNQVVLQNDGKILLAGYSGDQASTNLDLAFARYNANGTLDSSFGTNGKTLIDIDGSKRWQSARAVIIQSDGKIVATGFTDIANEQGSYNTVIIVTRLNSNGLLDNGFGNNGTVQAALGQYAIGVAIKAQPDGKFLVLATSKVVQIGGYEDFVLLRYHANGTLDQNFGTNGIVTTTFDNTDDIPGDLILQPDGKILAIGTVAVNNGSTLDFAAARYNPDGSLDNTFGNGGKIKTDFAGSWDFGTSAALQKDGKILIGGYSRNGNDYNFALARYNNDASLPVKLVSFDAKLIENKVELDWKTESEFNSDYFEIQRSSDGNKWSKIGRVNCSNNNSGNLYSFTDLDPSIGSNLYRLMMVDIDHTSTFSRIKELIFNNNISSNFIEFFPNPAHQELNIRVADSSFENIKLINQLGQEVYSSDNQVESIDLKSFAAGSYVLVVTKKDRSRISERIIIKK